MKRLYRLLGCFFGQKQPPTSPQRILVLKPCCIGDVIMTTALVSAIRRAYPHAHITFAVGRWSLGALQGQPIIDQLLDLGASANPAKSIPEMWQLVRSLRSQTCDMAFVPDRSPLLGVATWLAGIPHRIGLDSDGRGFTYTVRARVHPDEEVNESIIYLRLAEAIGIPIDGIFTRIDIPQDAQQYIDHVLMTRQITSPYVVIHPSGGANPGMVMDSKRWLPQHFARLAEWLYHTYQTNIIFIGARGDAPVIRAVTAHLQIPYHDLTGELNLIQIGALGKASLLYIGNDTGLTHLVAATGAKTVMILGPSSPKRYAPYHPNALALWKPVALPTGGVIQSVDDWDWERDGIGVDDVIAAIASFLSGRTTGGQF